MLRPQETKMISDRSPGYWSTGIIVRHMNGKWAAAVKYFDDGFLDDSVDDKRISTEGELHTRYFVADGAHADGLTAAVDAVKADAERLGIRWTETPPPSVYMEGDGEHAAWPAPLGWRSRVNEQARRLGWRATYTTTNA
jgi:hypothetical protein